MAPVLDSRIPGFRDEYDHERTLPDARSLTDELRIEREARGLLRFWFAQPMRKRDVIERVRRDPTIREEVRRIALKFAERFPDSPPGR